MYGLTIILEYQCLKVAERQGLVDRLEIAKTELIVKAVKAHKKQNQMSDDCTE